MSSPQGWSLENESKSKIQWSNQSKNALVITRKMSRGKWVTMYPNGDQEKPMPKDKARKAAVEWMREHPTFGEYENESIVL